MPIIIDDPDQLKYWGLESSDPNKLRVFRNGYETVIAKNEEDATACLCEVLGYGDAELEDSAPWEEVKDHQYIELRCDELMWHISQIDEPTLNIPEHFAVSIRARADEWVKCVGRNVLCSTEW